MCIRDSASAVRAMLAAAFDRLNLARVYLRVCADNRRAIRCYPVSYTHLRAHETPEHLVCRLLLEKKNNKM